MIKRFYAKCTPNFLFMIFMKILRSIKFLFCSVDPIILIGFLLSQLNAQLQEFATFLFELSSYCIITLRKETRFNCQPAYLLFKVTQSSSLTSIYVIGNKYAQDFYLLTTLRKMWPYQQIIFSSFPMICGLRQYI